MPICKLYTSRTESEIKDGIEMRMSRVIADILGKPLEFMIVMVFPNTRMTAKASAEPACLLAITAIGVFDSQRNRTYDQPLKQLLYQELNLSPERCMINYIDIDPEFKA